MLCDDYCPSSSTSTSVPRADSSSPAEQGFEILEKFLLHNCQNGITASLFNVNVNADITKLRHLVSLHGIVAHGLSVHECRALLFRHVFSGHCVSKQCSSVDRTACLAFASGFQSANEMSFAAFSIMASAKLCQRSNDDFLLVLRDLEVHSNFRPRQLRQQLIREMDRQAKSFLTSQLASSPHACFIGFERHSRATLLAIVSAHGINVKRYTGTNEDLKDTIMAHFATGSCFQDFQPSDASIQSSCPSSSASEACQTTSQCVRSQAERDITSKTEFLLSWLTLNVKKGALSQGPLQRLLCALNIEYNPDDNLRQLRSHLKKYVTVLRQNLASLQNDDRANAERTKIQERLAKIHSEWPALVPQSLKDKIITMFREQTSSATLMSVTCASCAESCLSSTCSRENLRDIDIGILQRPDLRLQKNAEQGTSTVVDPNWLDPDIVPPVFPSPIPSVNDIMLDPAGVHVENLENIYLTLCKSCKSSIQSGRVPPLALANHMVLGEIPDQLKDLTVVEEAMIAMCRAKCWVVQLKENISDSSFASSPNAQRGVKGHIIIYPQRPSAIAKILPPPLDDISTPMCVIFVGSTPPSDEWLREKAKPLAVRREKVRDALMWLKLHNPLYKDITINHGLLNSLPTNYMLPVHLEHVLPNAARDSLTSRYDTLQPQAPPTLSNPQTNDEPADTNSIPFQNVVITDVDGSAPANELRAAAIRHVKKKGGGYIEINHDPAPVNEFFNPDMFPMIYPTLFPYGIGGFENCRRSASVSLKHHTKHLFSLADRRFQEHYSFLFTVFNILQRREILLHTSLKVKKKNFSSIAQSFASVSAEAVHVVSERIARGDWKTCRSAEEQQVINIMKEVNVISSHVPGSAAARVVMRNEIRGLMIEKGLPSFYVTINPADVYNPLVKFLAGAEIDIDKLLPEHVPDYWEQSLLIAKNPAVAAKFFDIYMRAFISAILGHDPDMPNLDGGIFGIVNAYYGCVEAQGRGTLHCHMLVWIEGSLNPNEIKDRILTSGDVDFRDRLLAFLDDTIANSIPAEPNIGQHFPLHEPHPCAIRGVNLSDNKNDTLKNIERQRDLHRLVKQCQLHSHSQTCYKYWKGPLSGEPRECRFDLDEKNTCAKSSFDNETGELNLRCLDGLVNNFNLTIIEAVRCNMDVKFIGSGPSAKAVLYYITDYITKSQLKSHVAFAALELAVKKLGEYNKDDDESTIRAKHLLQKCAYAMISHQELSAQQVCSYLMDFGDHYTSHEFRNLYWTAFERFIDHEDPMPNNQLRQQSPSSDHSSCENTDYENSDHAEEDSEQADTSVLQDAADTDILDEDEVIVMVQPNGELIAKTNQVLDYQQRSPLLRDVCLWDMTAQVDKVKQKRMNYPHDISDDTNSHDDVNMNIEQTDNSENSTDMLTSLSRNRPTCHFSTEHPDQETHAQRVRHILKRLVPVPVGPSLPRRDREQCKERYCRLMLIMFKPWRHAKDLRMSTESWSSAFQSFLQDCSPQKKQAMDNMQILHECKDSRDDHFVQRRNRNRNRASQIPSEITQTQDTNNDNNDFVGNTDSEETILDHLLSITDSQPATMHKTRQDVLTCLKYTTDCGLFSSPSDQMLVDSDFNDGLDHVGEEELTKEDIWKAEYENRRLQWKKRTCELSSSVQISSTDRPNNTNDRQILNDGSAFRINVSNQENHEPLQPHIQPFAEMIDPEPMVAVEQLVEEFTLNKEQARAFRIVAEHSMKNKPSPLRMYLGGSGGTGKSRVINALKDFFNRRNQNRRFRLSSYTGVAAQNISGMTLHAALCLNQRTKKGLSGKTRRDLIAMWEGVDYLFIDEVSMIGCRLLLRISEALSDAKQNPSPFGGINVIFAGDFAQLPPVGESRLFSHINPHDAKGIQGQQNIYGKLLWLSVTTVVILTENMRQHGPENKALVSLLNRLREGKCTSDDFDLLNSKQLSVSDFTSAENEWSNVPIIVTNNECKDALNVRATAEFAAKTGRPMHWYYATDTRSGKEIQDQRLHQHLESIHSGKTNQRMKKIPMVIGMPVMICQNFDVEHGIVNGCTGTLKSIRYKTDNDGHRRALSCIVNAPTTTGEPLTGLEAQSVVVLRDTTDMRFVHPYSHKTCTIKRSQVPIMPAFAMTAHKAQGQTMDRAIVDLESCVGTESPYVMLSRVRSIEGLRILRPFHIAKIQYRLSEDARREFRRLDFLRLTTIINFGSVSEGVEAEKALSKTKYRDQVMSTIDNETNYSDPSGSARQLHHLQQKNFLLTSTPCPQPSLPATEDELPSAIIVRNTTNSDRQKQGVYCSLHIAEAYIYHTVTTLNDTTPSADNPPLISCSTSLKRHHEGQVTQRHQKRKEL